MSTALPLPPPASLSLAREQELAARFEAAEARLIRAAAALIRRADGTGSWALVILEAAGEVSPLNDESPIHDIVPFWDDLSQSSQHRVGEMLDQNGNGTNGTGG